MSDRAKVKRRVKELILDHEGADNPITSREINEEIDVDNVGSFPETRQLIREIIREERIPIGANTNGYFLIQTEDELEEYVDGLDTRMVQIADRKAAVLRAANAWKDDIESSDDTDLL